RREPVRDAGNDRHRRTVLAELPRPRLVEGGIILAVREVDLRVHDILQLRAGERERADHALLDDEVRLELDRLAAPLRALLPQRRRGDAVAARLVAARERRDAGNEDAVADGERRRIA